MSALPGTAHMASISRWTQLFAALVIGGALLLAGPRGQLGTLVGALLMVGNAWLLGFLVRRVSRLIAAGAQGQAGLVVTLLLIFNVKLLILAVLIYLCIRLLPIDPLAFILGLSILPAAILARAVQYGLAGSQEDPPAGAAREL